MATEWLDFVKLTASLPLKNGGWKVERRSFLFGKVYVQHLVLFLGRVGGPFERLLLGMFGPENWEPRT